MEACSPRVEKTEGKVVVAGVWSDADDTPFRLFARMGDDLPSKKTKQALSYFLTQLYGILWDEVERYRPSTKSSRRSEKLARFVMM